MHTIGLEGVDYINQEPKLTKNKQKKTTVNVFHCVNTSVQISGLGKIYFYVLERSILCSSCIYLIRNTVKVIILQF